MTFTPNRNLIDKNLADRSHAFTSFDPEKRAEQEIQGFVQHIQNVYDTMLKHAKTDAQKELLDKEIERYQSGYAQKYNSDLAAKGRTFSSMITGGSNFPTRKHEKANKAEENRYEEMREWDKRAQAAILRELKKVGIEEQGGELQAMKNKIADAEEAQEIYKKINTVVRKKNLSDDEKVQEIVKSTGYKESTARSTLTKDFAGRVGIPSYVLTNNLANIKRMKERLSELEKKESTPSGETVFEGGSIVDNASLDRIQILFDKIPSEEIRTKLKGQGWRFSPREKAWQRMRTDASRQSAIRITGAVERKIENLVEEVKKELAQGITVTVPERVVQEHTSPITGEKVKNTFDIVSAEELARQKSFQDQLHYFLNPKGLNFNKLVADYVDDYNKKHYIARQTITRYIVEQAINNQRLSKGETITIPEATLKEKERIKDNPELSKALNQIKTSFDVWYSSGGTLDSEYSTDMLSSAISKTSYKKQNGHVDLERLLSDLKNAGYKNLREWYEPQRVPKGETIVVPENVLKSEVLAQKEPWEMTYREFADMYEDKYNGSGYSFAERVGKPLGIQSQAGSPLRVISGKKYGYPQSLQKNSWRYVILQDAINRGKKLPNENMKEYLEDRKNYSTLREPWEKTKDEFWREGAGGKSYEGRGTSDYNHKLMVKDALAEGKPVPSEVLKEYPDLLVIYKRESMKEELSKGETVTIPESTLTADLNKPMKNVVATYRNLAWDAKEKGKYKEAAEFYGNIIKDLESHPEVGEMYRDDLSNMKKQYAEMTSLSKVQKGETATIPESILKSEVKPTVPTEGAGWRKFKDHKSETKAVKEALKAAGIEAEVGHGSGTAWSWLEINLNDPRTRNGLRPPPNEHQYNQEEQALHNKALKIALGSYGSAR